jgi:hypothetical protein
MHTSTREEANLTDTTDEPKPHPETSETPTSPEPETGEQEITALVPAEPEVVDGEVIELEPPETIDVHTPPKQTPYWLLIPFTILCCLVFLAGSYLLPLFTPMATVTILPIERGITITTAIQVYGRQVLPLTVMQSITVAATGKRHQAATRASGTITFYNGLLSSQTIAAGTVLTGQNGVEIITDQPAPLPAANPPMEGQVTVSAHAITTGASGNIPAYDIDQACCVTSVLAKNIKAFTGGQSARSYTVVTKSDLEAAATTIKTTLDTSEQAALNAQAITGESLTPLLCSKKVLADHQAGDETRELSVTVSETCSSIAYAAHDVDQDATQMITAAKRLGTGYSLLGDTQVTITHATITNQVRGIATLTVKLEATFVYQITPREKRHLLKHIAGKTRQQALTTLLHLPGIQGAAITIKGNAAALPDNPGSITIVVAER